MSGLFRALHRTKVFRNLTEQEFAWVLYDVGNSAFIMLACSLIPIWFKSLAIGTGPGKISSDQATAYYSIAISIVTVVVALIGPVCGVLADRKDKKTSVYKGYKQDKIEMRGDRAEMSDFPLYLNTVAGGLDHRDQTIGGFSFVVKIYAVPVVEIIG